jgi:hypothetical protein
MDRLKKASPIAYLVAATLQGASFGLRCISAASPERTAGYKALESVAPFGLRPIQSAYYVLEMMAYVAAGLSFILLQRSHLSDPVTGGTFTADDAHIGLIVTGSVLCAVAVLTELGEHLWSRTSTFSQHGPGTPLLRMLLLAAGLGILAEFSGMSIASLVAPGIAVVGIAISIGGVIRRDTDDVIWQFAGSATTVATLVVALVASSEVPCGDGLPESTVGVYGE